MEVTINSDAPIFEDTIRKIYDIFAKSNCPNESLASSIDNFAFFNGHAIQLGRGGIYKEVVNV